MGNHSGVIVWRARVSGIIVLEGVSLRVILCGGVIVSGAKIRREIVLGGNCPGGSCPGEDCSGAIVWGVKVRGEDCPRGNFMGGNYLGPSCLGGNFH